MACPCQRQIAAQQWPKRTRRWGRSTCMISTWSSVRGGLRENTILAAELSPWEGGELVLAVVPLLSSMHVHSLSRARCSHTGWVASPQCRTRTPASPSTSPSESSALAGPIAAMLSSSAASVGRYLRRQDVIQAIHATPSPNT